jgi:23S rRNA pseudouridine2605 synthase
MKTELQRIISKRGIASRKEAAGLILSGHVLVNGQLCLEPSKGFDPRVVIEISGEKIVKAQNAYLVMNKPSGLVVTRRDEKGRPSVYECLKNWNGPLVQAVGRLDMASEGLLLFTNDHLWADSLMDPRTHLKKIYHVHVGPIPSLETLSKLSKGIIIDGEKTKPASFTILRSGEKNAWIEVELYEGRNRQIRKMLESESIEVLRLIRVQIGALELGKLPKREWRELTKEEIQLQTKEPSRI